MDGAGAIKKAYEAILKSDFEEAIAWFEQAIALEPGNAAYHYKLSITYARSNKLDKAVDYGQKAVGLDPADEHFRYHYHHLLSRQRVLQAGKLFEEPKERLWLAVELLKEASQLDPLSVEVYLMLAMAYAGLNEYDRGIKALKELLRLDPQHTIGRQLLHDYELQWKQYMKGISQGMQTEGNE